MPRFVILEHDHPTLHWDFMLEACEVLRTWRLLAAPAMGQSTAAEASFDHRKLYLDYEGPVSGGRGQVSRWDAGIFDWESDRPGQVVITLRGERIQGRAILAASSDDRWTLCLEPFQ